MTLVGPCMQTMPYFSCSQIGRMEKQETEMKQKLETEMQIKDAPITGHMEKQETEIKQKLEIVTGNRKLKTEMEMQLLRCCSPSKI